MHELTLYLAPGIIIEKKLKGRWLLGQDSNLRTLRFSFLFCPTKLGVKQR